MVEEGTFPLSFSRNISNTRDSVSARYPNTGIRVEDVTRSRVFLTVCGVWIAN